VGIRLLISKLQLVFPASSCLASPFAVIGVDKMPSGRKKTRFILFLKEFIFDKLI
jgi:hypothetical protein